MTFESLQYACRKGEHIYKIVSDIDLGGNTLIFDQESVLDFQGGSLNNGSVNVKNVYITGHPRFNNCTISSNVSRNFGTSANIVNGIIIGQQYYLTSSGHKVPIYWDGSAWRESDGAVALVKRTGPTTDRPIGSSIYAGFVYNDTTLGKPIFAKVVANNDVVWVDSDGARADVPKSGNFADKPMGANIYIGFCYYCTDRKIDTDSASPTYMQIITPGEGDTGGMPIYYKGKINNVVIWTDALGRVVS